MWLVVDAFEARELEADADTDRRGLQCSQGPVEKSTAITDPETPRIEAVDRHQQ